MIAGIKEKILDTSMEMFMKKGYEQTSIRAIAEECGVTHANILYHFKGKSDISKYILKKYLDALEAETSVIASGNSLRPSVSKATLFWVMHLCYMVEYPSFAHVYSDMLKDNRGIVADILLSHKDDTAQLTVGNYIDKKNMEDVRLFSWKMNILSDADFRTIEMLSKGDLNLREAAGYMVDFIYMLFTGRKIPETTLNRDVSLMLDLISSDSLKRIYNDCVK